MHKHAMQTTVQSVRQANTRVIVSAFTPEATRKLAGSDVDHTPIENLELLLQNLSKTRQNDAPKTGDATRRIVVIGDRALGDLVVTYQLRLPTRTQATDNALYQRIADLGWVLPEAQHYHAAAVFLGDTGLSSMTHEDSTASEFLSHVRYSPDITTVRRVGEMLQLMRPCNTTIRDALKARSRDIDFTIAPPPISCPIQCTLVCASCMRHEATMEYDHAFRLLWRCVAQFSRRTEGDIGLVCPRCPDKEKYSARTLGRNNAPTREGHPAFCLVESASTPVFPPVPCSVWFLIDVPEPRTEWFVRSIHVSRTAQSSMRCMCSVVRDFLE